MTDRFKISRRTTAVLFAVLIGAATFAAAASNTVPASRAGDGNGAISGYTVTNVAYTLSASTPSEIDLWTFDLNAAASLAAASRSAGSRSPRWRSRGTRRWRPARSAAPRRT